MSVDVHSGVYVVNQIPTRVIRVVIHHKIIAAGPAPILGFVPVPISDFEEKPAREPEAVMVAIDSSYTVPIGRAEVLEVPVLEWMVDVEALVARSLMPVPVVVADVRGLVHMPAVVALDFPFHVLVLSSLGCRRNVPAVRARSIAVLTSASMPAAAVLCLRGKRHNCCQCEN